MTTDKFNFIPPVFITPLSDYGFKTLFASEKNKNLLVGFLNAFFPEKHFNSRIKFLTTEYQALSKENKNVIFDVLCETDNGETFIIEMQRRKQKNFANRAFYYSTFLIQRQPKGEDWDYQIAPVYSLSIMDFELFGKDTNIIHRCSVNDEASGERIISNVEYYFIELPKFHKEIHELETDLDKWFYIFKHASELKERPQELDDEIFVEFFEKARFVNLTPSEQAEYRKRIMYNWDEKNRIRTAAEDALEQGIQQGLAKGLEEGREQGLEKGLEQGRENVARKLLEMGMDDAAIIQACELTQEKLDQLKK